MNARERIPGAQLYDVRLRDMMDDPVAQLEALYRHFEIEYNDELAERFKERIADKPTAQEGEHDYSIEDFGLTSARVREVFSKYNERFGV
jgi:hypothetical protein